jgi:hypothetical protein
VRCSKLNLCDLDDEREVKFDVRGVGSSKVRFGDLALPGYVLRLSKHEVQVSEFRMEKRVTFWDERQRGLTIDLVIAIDFSHEAKELHKMGSESAFATCLRRILDGFEELGNDQKFAVFGFAAQAGDESGCFPLRMSRGEWPVPGRQGIFDAYRAFLGRSDVKCAHCVSFHKVVECASRQPTDEAKDRKSVV